MGRPKDPLYKAFEGWLNDLTNVRLEQDYLAAVRLVSDVSATPEDANALLVSVSDRVEDDNRIRKAGLFASAVYNRIKPDKLVFDVDAEDINFIGYRFEGLLVNNGEAGNWFGQFANGLVVNNGKAGDWFGWNADGLL